jgi:hypothetical protein
MLIHLARKAMARKIAKGGGGASDDSLRAKVNKGEEDSNDAEEVDALSPHFSAFAAAACVINPKGADRVRARHHARSRQ